MADVLVVSEEHHIDALGDRISNKSTAIVATSNELKDMLVKKRMTVVTPHIRNYSDDLFMKWMKQLPSAIERNGVDMLTELSYDGLSYWWLMEKWLFRGDGHFDSISDILGAVETLDYIIKKYHPGKIIYVDDGRLYSNVIKYIASNNASNKLVGTEAVAYKDASLKKQLIDVAIKRFWTGSFYIRRALAKSTTIGKNIDVLFIRGITWDRIYDYKTDTTEIIEPFTTNLKNSFSNSLSVGVQIGQFLNMRDIRGLKDGHTIIEKYYDDVAKEMHENIVERIGDGFERLIENDNFRKSFVFMNYHVWPLMEKSFKRYIDVRLDGHARMHAMISRTMDIAKPKVAVSPEEVSEIARILFHSCIKHGATCVAIQHGIFDNNILCYHNNGEISHETAVPRLCPIPAKTCVYGKYFKNILVKNGRYPTSSVIVTGSQRFDRIKNQEFSKESFYRQHNIPSDKKMAAFVTSPTPFNAEMTKTFLEEMKKIPGAKVVIKIHPSEKRSFYEAIINDANSDAIVLDDADLYDVLNASDIMVTYMSTAGLEAMLFGKPVAVLNLTGAEDIATYASAGAAAGIYKREEIVAKINDLLSNGPLCRKVQKIAKKYIRQNARNEDGRATERIAEVIKSAL